MDRFNHSTTQQNTFVYLYSHKGTASFGPNTSEFQGTSHADDLISTFPLHKTLYMSSLPTKEDRELYRLIPKMWTNFAATGYDKSF